MRLGSKEDPLATYGVNVGASIFNIAMSAPIKTRKVVLRTILDTIDLTLWNTVSSKATAFEKQGMPTTAALRRALQIAFANGVLKALSSKKSNTYQDLGLWGVSWSDVKDVGKTAVKWSPPGIVYQGTKKAYEEAKPYVEKGLDYAKQAGCWVANQPWAVPAVATGLTISEAAVGIPPSPLTGAANAMAAGAGVAAARQACNKAAPPPVLPPPPVVVPSQPAKKIKKTYTAQAVAKPSSSTPLLAGGLLAALLLL